MGYGLSLKYPSQGHVLDASSQLGALFGEVLETWGGDVVYRIVHVHYGMW